MKLYIMTELSAAIGLAQLDDIELHVGRREKLSQTLSKAAGEIDGVTSPHVRDNCRHVYYVWAAKIDSDVLGVSREVFSKALAAEGLPNFEGYLAPLYMLPIFQKRIAMGRDGFPFNGSDVEYKQGMCPVVEDMKYNKMLGFEPCIYDISDSELLLIQDVFSKLQENMGALKDYEYKEAS